MTGQGTRDHYIPQFYMRQFACADDAHKVEAFAAHKHAEIIIRERKSIELIGYEEGLHHFTVGGVRESIEGRVNREWETPFADSATWQKVVARCFNALDESDKEPLYQFIGHLRRRNVETRAVLEREVERFRSGAPIDYSADERIMYATLAASPQAIDDFYRAMILTRSPYAQDAREVGIMVYRSPLRLRSCTHHVVAAPLPESERSRVRSVGTKGRAWWLALDPHCGVLMTIGLSQAPFVNHEMPDDAARGMNRWFLQQLLQCETVRYMIADDEHINTDLEHAGYRIVQRGPRQSKYLRSAS
jgi:hypothetical protein